MDQSSHKSVIITGASGLLGRAVTKEFVGAGWKTVGLAFSRAHLHPNLVKLDICDNPAVEQLVASVKPTTIVHCAAERSPDVVDKQPDGTQKLNVEATKNLSDCARRHGAFFIYVSTDYVFYGNHAPYTETAVPNPINKYGASKLAGEHATLEVNPDAAILRIPILYGEVEKLSESAVTVLFEKLLHPGDKPTPMSHYERRYPTHAKDIAAVLVLLAEERLKTPSVKGIYHWSGKECMTKYEMVCEMAKLFNLSTDHVVADVQPSGGAARPYDAALSCGRLLQLGANRYTSFSDGMKEVLKPFVR